MYRLLDYGAMLRDTRRIEAYQRALAAAISPSMVVLDLGSGLGTFSVLACKLGAARVYAIEAADVIHLAEEIARANGVADRVQFIHAKAAETELPERVDVIVSDLANALPLFQERIPTIMHARDTMLKPGGVLIPQRDRLLCAPISSTDIRDRIASPWHSIAGVDFTPAAKLAMHAAHALAVQPSDLAAAPEVWAQLDYATIASPNVTGAVQWHFGSDAEIHAIALWFESTLAADVTTSSGPWSPDSVHATMVLPLSSSITVRAGESLNATIEATLVSGQYILTWQIAGGERQSTFLAEPRSRASRISKDVLSRRVGDEMLLLDLHAGVYHVLNATGARIWELLEQGEPAATIAMALTMDYEVDADRAAADVAAIIAQLQDAKLIA